MFAKGSATDPAHQHKAERIYMAKLKGLKLRSHVPVATTGGSQQANPASTF
jgi:hypothetical protein